MDATVVAGWIGGLAGVGGALVGAGVSVWATRATQREQARQNRETLEFQARQARAAQLTELDVAATETALSELIAMDEYLLQLHDHAAARLEDRLPWEEVVSGHLRRLQIAISRIPNRTVYARVMIPLELCRQYRSASTGPRHFHYVRLVQSLVGDMNEVLLAHRRGEEELPPLTEATVQAQERAATAQERWEQAVSHLLRDEPGDD